MPQKFFVNPRRKTHRRKRRRKLHGAALAAHQRKLARRKRRTYSHNARKGKATMARKRKVARRRRRRATAVVRRRRRTVPRVIRHRRRRRGGRGMARGLMPMITQGLQDGAGVAVGIAAAKTLPTLVGFGTRTGFMKYGLDALAAVVAGWGAHRFVGANFGRNVLAGGFASVIITFAKDANIPVLSSALGDYSFASYPQAVGLPGAAGALTGYGAYPEDEDVAGVTYMQ